MKEMIYQVSQWFELVVFTASMEIYGQAVADKLDSNQGMLNRRYYRQHCTLDFGSYTKDLSAICADLSSIFILDNSPGAYRAYPGKIQTYYSIYRVQTFVCLYLFSLHIHFYGNLHYLDNAIPIKSWFSDPSDTALLDLLPVLDALRFVSDVRSILNRNREAQRQW